MPKGSNTVTTVTTEMNRKLYIGKEQFNDIEMTHGSAESQITGLKAGCQQSSPKTRLWQAF